MQVGSICNADAAPDPPRMPPREEAGANDNPSEINDNAEENGATEDEDEDESASIRRSAGGFAGNGQSSEIGMLVSYLHPK